VVKTAFEVKHTATARVQTPAFIWDPASFIGSFTVPVFYCREMLVFTQTGNNDVVITSLDCTFEFV